MKRVAPGNAMFNCESSEQLTFPVHVVMPNSNIYLKQQIDPIHSTISATLVNIEMVNRPKLFGSHMGISISNIIATVTVIQPLSQFVLCI